MSTNPYGRQSGLNTTPNSAVAAGGVKIFSKAANPAASMQATAGEGFDTIRILKNKGSVDILIAETQAKSIDTAQAYALGAGEAITLLGPSGIGWGGDLWASSAGSAGVLHIISA